MNHLIRASVLMLACLAAPTLDASEKKEAREREKYRKEHEKACKALKLEAVKLDRTVVKAGEKLKATSALVNETKASVMIPKEPGESPSAKPKLGDEEWYLRRTDVSPRKSRDTGKAKEGTDPLDSGARVRRHGLIHWQSEIKPGERLELSFWAGEVDPKKENLRTGSYEITVEFTSESGVKWSASAPFKVENPDAVAPEVLARQQAERRAKIEALMKQFYPGIEMMPLAASTTTVRQGATFEVVGGMRNKTGADLKVPDDPLLYGDRKFRSLGTEQWYLEKCVPGRATGPATREGYGGSLFSLEGRDKLAPGEAVEFEKTVTTHDLKPGTYEISLQITDEAGKTVGLKSLRFRVTE